MEAALRHLQLDLEQCGVRILQEASVQSRQSMLVRPVLWCALPPVPALILLIPASLAGWQGAILLVGGYAVVTWVVLLIQGRWIGP